MGLGAELISDLYELKRAGAIPARARVVEIGAQQLSSGFLAATAELERLYEAFGKTAAQLGAPPSERKHAHGVELLPDAAPASIPFWTSLGFEYAAVEYGGHRSAIALDLNRDAVPPALKSSFDLVVNAGTTEHVVNQDNAFRVIHDLAKPGGLMMHDVPAMGMMTHGPISYNIQFFWLLCRDNDYEPLDLGLVYCGSAPVHPDVLQSNAQWARFANHRNERYSLPIPPHFEVPLFALRATLRKRHERAFITPLDLPAEAMPRRPQRDWVGALLSPLRRLAGHA